MISFLPDLREAKGLSVLCFGAHCDDIELGCGGTLLKWIRAGRIAHVHWVVFSSTRKRMAEAQLSAEQYLQDLDREILIYDYKDAYLPYYAEEIKSRFQEIASTCQPDIIFTHYRQDRHQDHRLLSELSWNAFRNHLILEYEIPKYDGDLGIPNTYVALPESIIEQKINLLLDCFASQRGKHWFDDETFRALPRIRGMECASDTRYAEAFHMRKCLL